MKNKAYINTPQSKKIVWTMVMFTFFMFLLPTINAGTWDNTNLGKNLVSYYTLDNTENDSMGYMNLTRDGGSFTIGKIGQAYNTSSATGNFLNATNDWSVTFNSSYNWTFSFWFNKSGAWVSTNKIFFGFYFQYVRADDSDGSVIFTTNNAAPFLRTKTKINDSLWHHIIIVHDGSIGNGNSSIYIDNILRNSTITLASAAQSTLRFRIGAGSETSTSQNKENIAYDEVGLWNRTLTLSEISSLYNGGNGLPYIYSAPYMNENSQTFNAVVTEGNSETFSINLTYNNSFYSNIMANLIYNGTSYTGTKLGSGDNVIFNKSINVPYVNAQTSYSFYWQIGLTNITGTFYFNSTFQNQIVNDLGALGGCDTHTILVLNYTLKDEKTQTQINQTNSTIEVNIQVYPYGSNYLLMNLSKLYNLTSNARVCFNATLINNSQYRLYTQARYYADGYITEYHYLQNFNLQNSTIPQQINLYDLAVSQSTEFIVTYKASNYLPVANALISVTRKYVSEGVFKTVEIGKTDTYGQTKLHFDTNNVIYTLIATKEGSNLSVLDNVAVFCEDPITSNCKINFFAALDITDIYDYDTWKNLGYSILFNQTTRTITAAFSTFDGSSSYITLNATRFDAYGNQTLCSAELPSSAGTLTCTIPASFQNITFFAKLYKDGELVVDPIFKIMPKASDIFDGNGPVIAVLMFGLLTSLMMMFIPFAAGVLIGAMIGIIILILLFNISGIIIGTSSALVYFVIAIIIIIWRMTREKA